MINDTLHGSDRSQSIPIPINDRRGDKEITQVAKLSEDIVVLYFDVYLLGFMLLGLFGTLLF